MYTRADCISHRLYLQQLSAFLDIIHPVLSLAGLVQLTNDTCQPHIVSLLKAQLTQLVRATVHSSHNADQEHEPL